MWKHFSVSILTTLLLSARAMADIKGADSPQGDRLKIMSVMKYWKECSIKSNSYASNELKRYFTGIQLYTKVSCFTTMKLFSYQLSKVGSKSYRVTAFIKEKKYFEFVARVKNNKVYPHSDNAQASKLKIYNKMKKSSR